MLLMCAILIFSLGVNVVLLLNISFKNYCIKELENYNHVKTRDFVRVLLELKQYQNFERAGRETFTRRCIEESIEKYATNKIKKELNINATNEKV